MAADYLKPLPQPDTDSAPFWEATREHRFVAQCCRACGTFRWPPRGVCPKCHSWDTEWKELSGRGVVESYVVAHRSFHRGFDEDIPYVIADIVLENTDEKVVVLFNIVGIDWEKVYVGMHVAVEFDDVTDEVTLPKFHQLITTVS